MKHTRTARTISLLMALLLFIELTFSTSVSLAFAENGEEDQTKTEAYDEPSQDISAAELSEETVLEKGEDYTIFQGILI